VTVAYVVLSHRNPGQVLRLVRALREGPGARVVVRHDQSRSRLAAADVEAAGGDLVEDDMELEWGGWSQLELIVACLRHAGELEPDWTLVLSGQDYPLRPLHEIEAGLAACEADARLGSVREIATRPGAGGDEEFFLRCAYRHYRRPAALPHLPRALRPLVYVRDLPPLVGLRRPSSLGRDLQGPLLRGPSGRGRLHLYSSADWLTLGSRALAIVLDAHQNARFRRFFRRVAVPSESFFATVLLNQPELTIERDNRRFASFAAPGAPHPDTLAAADLDRALASGADFARKFDAAVDARPLDLLDGWRGRPSARPTR
jgi:hypothetical protein